MYHYYVGQQEHYCLVEQEVHKPMEYGVECVIGMLVKGTVEKEKWVRRIQIQVIF